MMMMWGLDALHFVQFFAREKSFVVISLSHSEISLNALSASFAMVVGLLKEGNLT